MDDCSSVVANEGEVSRSARQHAKIIRKNMRNFSFAGE